MLCHLQAITSDLLRQDIIALYQPISLGYYGNGVGLSTWAGDADFQLGSTTNGKMEKHHPSIQTQTQQRKRPINIMMLCAAVMMGFTEQ